MGQEQLPSGETIHLWDGSEMVAEYAGSGNMTARYLRGIGLIAREQDAALGLQYYLHNAHGDVVERTDQYGTTLKRYRYDAFGVEKNPEPLDANPFRYCGEYFDLCSGTYYLHSRYYNPANGRFTSEDVARAGLNWYTYCDNNPVAFIDPFGLDALLVNKRIDGVHDFTDGVVTGPIDHMSAFFQDEDGEWWFFFWGNDVKYEKIDNISIFNDMDKMNEYLLGRGLLEFEDVGYHSSVYIKGDFADSHNAAQSLLADYNQKIADGLVDPNSFLPNTDYKFFKNNCGQITMDLFYKGTLPDGTNVGRYINQRGYFSTSVLPNSNISLMQDVFYNSALNLGEFNAAMQTQRNKYEGKGLGTQFFWLGLAANINRIA